MPRDVKRPPTDCTLAFLAASAFLGCGSQNPHPDQDAATDLSVPETRTLTYVIDRLTIDGDDDPTHSHTGFDLDGYVSGRDSPLGCWHQDFLSGDDLDQNCDSVSNEACTSSPNPGCAPGSPGCVGGVDNEMPSLANTFATNHLDYRAAIQAQIAAHHLVWIVRVADVQSFDNDPHVRITVFDGFPTFTDGCEAIAPGRDYSVSTSSLVPGGTDVDGDARVAFDGMIVHGRLRGRAAPDAIRSIPLIALTVGPIAAQGFQIGADFRAVELGRGDIGEWIREDDLITAVLTVNWQLSRDELRRAIDPYADLAIDGVCAGDIGIEPPPRGRIAVGFGFHAVPAAISPMHPIADAPWDGACGSMPDAGARDP